VAGVGVLGFVIVSGFPNSSATFFANSLMTPPLTLREREKNIFS
jgi:hypothetical protein